MAGPAVESLDFRAATASSDALRAIEEYVSQVLSYGSRWNVIEEALAADPHCVLALLLCADFEVARESVPEAVQLVQTAKTEASKKQISEREQLYLSAFEAWLLRGNISEACSKFCAVSAQYPDDLFALKRAQLAAFCLGDSVLMLHLATEAMGQRPSLAQRPYFNGMWAFALEQNKMLAEAEAAGRRGVAVLPSDAWSHHAVAHALYFQKRFAEGVKWMKDHSHYWRSCMSFMYTHNYFHLALFHLGLVQLEDVEKVFDQYVWNKRIRNRSDEKEGDEGESLRKKMKFFPLQDKCYRQDQLSALDLLWKYELYGGRRLGQPREEDGLSRWDDILSHCRIPGEHSDPLWSLLVLQGLCRQAARSRDPPADGTLEDSRLSASFAQAQHMLRTMEEAAEAVSKNEVERGQRLKKSWIGYGKALLHDWQGRPHDALLLMRSAVESVDGDEDPLAVVGGSSEQREVLHEHFCWLLCRAEGDDGLRQARAHAAAHNLNLDVGRF